MKLALETHPHMLVTTFGSCSAKCSEPVQILMFVSVLYSRSKIEYRPIRCISIFLLSDVNSQALEVLYPLYHLYL